MLIQNEMIQKVKDKCMEDQSIVSCMMYGSFTKSEGDQYSDIEFYIFLKDEEKETFNSKEWISDIHPADLIFFNEFGTEVAIFSNMIRGEFHFLGESEMDIIKSFKLTGVFPDTVSMHLYDTTGKLKKLLDVLGGDGPVRMTADNVNFAFNNFVNAWLMGVNVLKRGENARALETLTHVQRYVLQLIRIKEENTERWLNSTKNLEKDITREIYKKFSDITSTLEKSSLEKAYVNALSLVTNLYNELNTEYQMDVNSQILEKLSMFMNNND